MRTKELLDNFVALRDELEESYSNESWKVQRRLLKLSLRLCRGRIEFEKIKSKHDDVSVKFFESDEFLTADDIRNVKEASSINLQITRKLSDIKKI